jgi:hypothetical protein
MKTLAILLFTVTTAFSAVTTTFNQYINSSVSEVVPGTFRYSYQITPRNINVGNLEDIDIFFDGPVVIDFVRVPVVYPVTIEDESISWTLNPTSNSSRPITFIFETVSTPVVGKATVQVGGVVYKDNVWVPKSVAIPEPSQTLLIGLGFAMWTLRRKR